MFALSVARNKYIYIGQNNYSNFGHSLHVFLYKFYMGLFKIYVAISLVGEKALV